MSTNSFNKLRLLLWKDWILQWNHKCQLITAIVLPTIFSLLFLLQRSLSAPEYQHDRIYEHSFPIDSIDYFIEEQKYLIPNDLNLKYHLAYSPNTNNHLKNIIEAAAVSLNLSYSGHANAKELQNVLIERDFYAGIEFDDSLRDVKSLPKHLNYRIRFPSRTRSYYASHSWLTDNLFLPIDWNGPRNFHIDDGGVPYRYFQEGFLSVQNAVSMAFIRQFNKQVAIDLPEVLVQKFPYPEHTTDVLNEVISILLPIVIFISYWNSSTWLVKFITAEKEKQLKEVMKMMGLENWLHWTAWFVQGFVAMAISTLLIVIILTNKGWNDVPVLVKSSPTAVLFFFLVYTAATVTFCLMVSTFFSRANRAASVSSIVWFVSFVPYVYFSANEFAFPTAMKLGWSLLCNTAMGLGINIIVDLEIVGLGLQWNTMFTRLRPDDEVTMAHVLAVMIVSCFLNLIICFYMEQTNPGEFGVPKKWYFPFTKSFWTAKSDFSQSANSFSNTRRENSKAFQAEPSGKRIGMEVRALSKSFDSSMAVKDVTMNMFEDQITVMLGHNGAGKTTTISMLTGMFPPTSGTAIINGCDIRANMDGVRASLGICPQHNILFDELTVRQHLMFYSRLKGLSGIALEDEVTSYIKKLQLENEANVAVSALSGGMKRKLSVCAAFCGGSKVVLCDEPSLGMDPAARRQLWELLQAEKVGRTVLLTTNFMDEADVLGDRIAIMSAGELKCMGTPFFLKKAFGSGYSLVCVKNNNCKTSKVTQLLGKYIPNLKPASDIGTELSYQLPDKYSSHFEEMFLDLEKKSAELSLNGYGISITSLEEVFMKVGTEKEANSNNKGDQGIVGLSESLSDNHLLKGLKLTQNQWRAMMMKKYLFSIRNKMLFLIQNCLPILFMSAMLSDRTIDTFTELHPMTFSLKQYPETVTVLETQSSSLLGLTISKHFKDIVTATGSNHHVSNIQEPFINHMVKLNISQHEINSKYIAAATVGDKNITAWMSYEPLHSIPLTLNLIHNAMARSIIGPDVSISVANSPLPPFDNVIPHRSLTCLAVSVGFSMSIVSAFYVMFIIKERVTKTKLMQFVSGVKVWTFWVTHFVWDFLMLMTTSIIIICMLLYFEQPGCSTYDELGRIFLMLLLFGFSALPLTYNLAYLFTETSTGLSILSMINVIFGLFVFAIIFVLRRVSYVYVYEFFALAVPHFSLIQGIYKLVISEKPEVCELRYESCLTPPSYFAWESPGVLREVVALILSGILYFALLLLNDYRCFDIILYKFNEIIRKPPPLSKGVHIDEDVENEKKRVQQMSPLEISTQNLVLDQFSKFYGGFQAVNQISVALKPSECFGLLGVNGAGKTTTFKILTGYERISSGKAYVKGLSLKTKMCTVEKEIGYCPQFDALFDEMTGEETLRMFGLLRGIPVERISDVSVDLAMLFGLTNHYGIQVRALSGGNKRKLNTAVAIMGGPSVLYLDEPTTGMDSAARRQLWNVLCRFRDSGKTIMLSSHSIEECEALCTRLAIMVNGEFKCIGSIQHLQNRFSKGLILKCKTRKIPDNMPMELKEKDIRNVMDFISREFPEANLRDRFQGILTFYIPLSSVSWSKAFGLMERNKNALNIEDYSLRETTLEEVFLQFAQTQRNDRRDHKKKCSCLPC